MVRDTNLNVDQPVATFVATSSSDQQRTTVTRASSRQVFTQAELEALTKSQIIVELEEWGATFSASDLKAELIATYLQITADPNRITRSEVER